MARFSTKSEQNTAEYVKTTPLKYPFKNVYATKELNHIYVNMEATDQLKNKMVCLRDICLVIDMSGSMYRFYKDGSIDRMCSTIVDELTSYDDDGIDLFFFSSGLIHQACVASASEVKKAVMEAKEKDGAFGGTMPTSVFKAFCDQIKTKKRNGTILFLTDGIMDDAGKELKTFYQNVLHKEFGTRDKFYCFAVEFGRSAMGALDVLNGLYSPEGGPEDLFDCENADDLEKIAYVLNMIAGMSAVGNDDIEVSVKIKGGIIDTVNMDLIEGGVTELSGPINQVMSFRIQAPGEFTMEIHVPNHDAMYIKAKQDKYEVNLTIE
jgi:hypothetical protein